MMNFLLGTVAGGLIACVATITAARHPEVQARLGLIAPAVAAAASAPAKPETRCPAPDRSHPVEAKATETDSLFSRRRFWYVAP